MYRATFSRLSLRRLVASTILILVCLAASAAPQADSPIAPGLLHGLHWRSIGPARFGGRVTDVAGVPGNPSILYVAHSTGGLFKSTNGGTTFEPVFENGNTLSVGAVAVSPDNPDIVYIGTGEGNPRNSTSFGDGIYKTADGGKTWKHLGLEHTERFGRIVVNPSDPNIVLAAAMGHEWGPNSERGIYRSTDGGATWTRTLFVNPTTGASDVCLDPRHPNIVYAGMYDYLRRPWNLRSGGPGSGLYRSTDGGATWTRLTDPQLHNGLPVNGPLGRIGVSISRSNPQVVYAIIQSREGLLWRSRDGGAHWEMVNNDRRIDTRPFYFSNIRVDPANENRIYSLSGDFWVSDDAGKTFHTVRGASIFGDFHALWIDPTNASRLLAGSDGGFFISNDAAQHWTFVNNMPMAQPYHVGFDMDEPYHVMGGFQDHEIWVGPSTRWNRVGGMGGDWTRLRYMADGMNAMADPRDANIIYYNGHFGDITRLDMRNREERYIQPWPGGPAGEGAGRDKYRFNWNSPLLISPHDPNVVYYGGNVLFRTSDGGTHWTKISPDLTTNDPEKEKLSGGPIDPDNSRAEFYCTITAIAESPANAEVLWAGTDDGNVQVTRDGGSHWTNVASHITGVPAGGWVTSVNAAYHEPGTAYVSIDRHQLDDFAPYVFMTTDYGQSWKAIGAGLQGNVQIVAEDPKQPNLLYAGTELGLFASFDRGLHWTDLRLGLPHLPVYDLKVHPRENDLIIATHARGFYILDDVTPLQQLAASTGKKLAVFPPMPAIRYTPAADTSELGNNEWVAPNKPYGTIITYWLAPDAAGSGGVNVSILDGAGKLLRQLRGPSDPGLNRVVWDLREDPSRGNSAAGSESWTDPAIQGVRVLPGTYRVRIEGAGETVEQQFTVRLDPRLHVSPEELAAYDQTSRRVTTMMYTLDEALARIRNVDGQLDKLQSADPALRQSVSEFKTQLDAVRVDLQADPRDPEHLNIRGRLSWLLIQIPNFTGRPTPAQLSWIDELDQQLQQTLARMNSAFNGPLAALNLKLKQSGLTPIQTTPAPAPRRFRADDDDD